MKYVVAAGAWLCVALLLCVQPAPVRAQELKNSKITFKYEEPKEAKHQELYERLKKRQVLEQLAQFLSPVRLRKPLALTTAECKGEVNAYYNGSSAIILCYEYFVDLEAKVAAAQMPPGYNKADALVGGFLGVTIHEVGHALFDNLEIPVFGREEDAADQMAGFILQQFGAKIARRMVGGAAIMWAMKDQKWDRTTFSDEHGSELQRHYNFLCLGYGGDPKTFQDFVDKGALPPARAKNCAREYQLVRNAFVKTVLPYIDQAMMKKVQSMEWLREEDFK
jgi:hypothetical protein